MQDLLVEHGSAGKEPAAEVEIALAPQREDILVAAEREVEEARLAYSKCYGSVGGLRGKLTEEENRQAESDSFDGAKLIELRQRLEHQERRSVVLKNKVLESEERLRERQREYRAAVHEELRRRCELAVADMHEKLQAAEAASHSLLALHAAACRLLGPTQRACPPNLSFPALLKHRDADCTPTERWRRFAERRLLGQE